MRTRERRHVIYRQYDRAGLDAQYNLRARVPGFQDYYDGWRAWSDRVAAALPGHLDLAYGPTDAEKLDLFVPEGAPGDLGAPIHVFIHGGYWRAMDKADFRYVAEGLVPHGAAVAVVNYALVPAVTIDEIVRQNQAALAWLWHNAADYGGDPEKIFVSGHSAGGHLTAMMMAADWPAFDPALPKDLVKGGCAISGVFDLEPVRLCYLNDDMGMDADTAARNSPIRHLNRVTPAPLILCVGGDETDEFLRQQAAFADAWAQNVTSAGAPVTVVDAPGHHHFTVVDELARADSPLNRAVRDQMSLP